MSRRVLVVLCLGTAAGGPPLAHGSPVFLPATGHSYDYKAVEVCWAAAMDMARFGTFVDSTGVTWLPHLATVTSLEEDDFLTTAFGQAGWIAGADPDVDGAWIWQTGDEAGQVFWNNGPTVIYANWRPGAPSGDPSRICLLKQGSDESGSWDDRSLPEPHGFYVEYVPDDSSVIRTTSWGAIKRLFR